MTLPAPETNSDGSLWKGLRNLILAGLVLAVAGFGIWYALHGDSFRRANPGDCLNVAVGLGIIRDAQIVDCTSAQAKSKVLGGRQRQALERLQRRPMANPVQTMECQRRNLPSRARLRPGRRAVPGTAEQEMTYRRGLSALLALGFLVAACDAATSPVPAENTTQATGSPPPAAPAQTYTARDHDLCTKTDLSVLQPTLGLTVRMTRRERPYNGAGEACVFELNTPSGHPATLRVESAAATTEGKAEQIYKAQVTGRMPVEGAVAGIGEHAEAFALETEPGFKYGEYKIHARDDNLVIEVWLAVGGNTFPPKSHTGGIVRHISDDTYRALYFAWRST